MTPHERVFVELSATSCNAPSLHQIQHPTAFSTRLRSLSFFIMASSLISFLVAGLFARLCAAQASGWIQGQVNTTMCYWQSPRGTFTELRGCFLLIAQRLEVTDGDAAAVIRDTLYIDGGYLWWEPGLDDGTYGPLINDGNEHQERPQRRDQCLFAKKETRRGWYTF